MTNLEAAKKPAIEAPRNSRKPVKQVQKKKTEEAPKEDEAQEQTSPETVEQEQPVNPDAESTPAENDAAPVKE